MQSKAPMTYSKRHTTTGVHLQHTGEYQAARWEYSAGDIVKSAFFSHFVTFIRSHNFLNICGNL
jgi:hypothetical protein